MRGVFTGSESVASGEQQTHRDENQHGSQDHGEQQFHESQPITQQSQQSQGDHQQKGQAESGEDPVSLSASGSRSNLGLHRRDRLEGIGAGGLAGGLELPFERSCFFQNPPAGGALGQMHTLRFVQRGAGFQRSDQCGNGFGTVVTRFHSSPPFRIVLSRASPL